MKINYGMVLIVIYCNSILLVSVRALSDEVGGTDVDHHVVAVSSVKIEVRCPHRAGTTMKQVQTI